MIQRITAALAVLMLVAATGCGGGGDVKVAGDVSFKGEPVPKGEIIFSPSDGGQSVAAAIENGRYEMQVPLGQHQVRITGYRDVPGKFDRSNPGQETPIVEMYIPDQYNAKTTLDASVDSSTDQLDFPLEQG